MLLEGGLRWHFGTGRVTRSTAVLMPWISPAPVTERPDEVELMRKVVKNWRWAWDGFPWIIWTPRNWDVLETALKTAPGRCLDQLPLILEADRTKAD